MTTIDIHALAGAYALDAVDDLERAAFERHLASCESCQGEIVEFRETVARLADSAWSAPPPRLRTDVMTAIGRTRQVPAAPAVRRSPRSGWRRWAAGGVAAAVLAGAVGTSVFVVQDQRVRDERQQVAEASQEAAAARQQAATAAQQTARVRQIMAAPDLVVRTGPMLGGGKVTVATSTSQHAGVVFLGATAAPSGGRVYEVWAIRGQSPTPAATLTVGQASAVQVVEGLPGTSAVGVTAEPAGGSKTPTLPLVAAVTLT